jgi:hypothetical protein
MGLTLATTRAPQALLFTTEFTEDTELLGRPPP